MNIFKKIARLDLKFEENEWLLEQKIKTLIWISFIVIQVLMIFTIIRFVTGDISTAIANIVGVIGFYTLIKVLKKKKEYYNFVSITFIMIATILVSHGIYVSGYSHERGIWLIAVLVSAYYLRDKKEGLIWMGIDILILLLAIYLNPNPNIAGYLVVIFSIILVASLLYFYDEVKEKEQEIVVKQNNKLELSIKERTKELFDLNNSLEERINEQTKALQKSEESLKHQIDFLQKIMDTVPVRIFWKDYNLKYLGCNKLFAEDANLKNEQDIIGKSDYDMVWSDEADMYNRDDTEVIRTGISKINIEEPQTQKDGKQIWLSTAKVPLKDSNGDIYGILGAYIDITAIKESKKALQIQSEELEYQAHHDSLTGLPNRILFHDRLEHAIKNAIRENKKVALLFIDLDHFKEINDSLGHDIGDKILQQVTQRLQKTIRDRDMIARLGGDEFTVILENITQIQDVSTIAEKLLKALSEDINCEEIEKKLYISNSIGISIYPDDGDDTQSLLKYADSAMYKAKDEGRNNYQYYSSEMTELAFERLAMETALRASIKNEEFIVYYQAQVDGRTNRLIGMEALVRWNHPSMGIISPAKFIPLAESTGLIVELDKYVMKTAMSQIAQWYKNGLNPGVLAMNLAVQQLKQEDFIQTLQSMMKATNCKPEWIELEVTESQVMINPEEAIKILKEISDLGIELAIDDFGTGYSSLAYLKRLPIDKLKIDQAFVKDLPDDEESAGIAKSVIALAQSLNLRVIAEGVEKKEQKDFLVENGCDNIQGYYYSQPIPTEKFEKILKKNLNSSL